METGTIEQALPGLEHAGAKQHMIVGRAVLLTPQKRLATYGQATQAVMQAVQSHYAEKDAKSAKT